MTPEQIANLVTHFLSSLVMLHLIMYLSTEKDESLKEVISLTATLLILAFGDFLIPKLGMFIYAMALLTSSVIELCMCFSYLKK